MIDLHIHILPGMDDGSQSMEESLEMAQIAVESGVTDMAVTPHSYADEYFFKKSYRSVFDSFKRQLKENGIDLNIYPGMEILAFSGMTEYLNAGALKTINGTKYVLVEFTFDSSAEKIDEYIRELISSGYRPVVAHVERYIAVQKNILLAYDLHAEGCVLQMNKGSIVGRFGRHAMRTAWDLLNARLINIVASDAHSYEYRTPDMRETEEILETEFSPEFKDILLYKNPKRILYGKGILRFEPLQPETSWRR